MLRIPSIVPPSGGTTPQTQQTQPTQPINTIKPLLGTGIPVSLPTVVPTVIKPSPSITIQPIRVAQPILIPTVKPITPTIPIRPIQTPVLAGGRSPIPVQAPRVLPTVQLVQAPRVLPTVQLVQAPRVLPTVQPVIPITRVPIARPTISPTITQRSPPISPVVQIVRPPLSPFSATPSVIPVMQRLGLANRKVLPVPIKQVIERPLGEWQLDWFARVRGILGQHYGYIDTSQPGAGKTSFALWVAKTFGLPVLVVAPAGIVDAGVWPREAQRVGAQHLLIDVISYNTLAGKKFKQPSHPYLTSLDRITEGGVVQTRFDATEYYKNITARGCLLIFDEFSNLKNTSRKLKASLEMLANVIVEGGPSRYALLSGTPFDKEGHAVNILRALRYIRAPRLYYKDPVTKQVTLEGLHELIEACRIMDSQTTDRIVSEHNIDSMTTEMSQSLVYDLYTTVIKQAISGSMTSPPTEGLHEKFNGFFNINPNDLTNLKQGIEDLAKALRFDPITGQIAASKGAFGKVTPALRIIEFAKIHDMIRVAKSYLQQYPTMKVILAVNYTETVDALMAGLTGYGPIQFDGRTKKKQRGLIEDLFRDSPNHRVLVGNITVIGKGLSFQAFRPEELRLTIVSPSYHMLDISQVAYRTNRAGKKGDAYVYIFYGQGNGIEMETKILEAMVRKTDVVKGTLDENGNELQLPGQYRSYYEPIAN